MQNGCIFEELEISTLIFGSFAGGKLHRTDTECIDDKRSAQSSKPQMSSLFAGQRGSWCRN
jgi:hypothetical protein